MLLRLVYEAFGVKIWTAENEEVLEYRDNRRCLISKVINSKRKRNKKDNLD